MGHRGLHHALQAPSSTSTGSARRPWTKGTSPNPSPDQASSRISSNTSQGRAAKPPEQGGSAKQENSRIAARRDMLLLPAVREAEPTRTALFMRCGSSLSIVPRVGITSRYTKSCKMVGLRAAGFRA